jgi:ABC-type branched-subunit amino acid transport system substrate-binding protein
VPVTGRYAVQGAQVRAGLELWARRAGASILLEDDGSRPERAARLHPELLGRACRFVLGPYGSDCTRAVAGECRGGLVWNHGAAADDVQGMPGVVSVPSPASRYLVALGGAVAALRPGAAVALVIAGGAFARFAREGLERAAGSLDLDPVAWFSFSDPPAKIAGARCDAVLACGPLKREIELFRSLAARRPDALLGGVSPGLAAFPSLLHGDPEGLIAPVQWHPELENAPELGPTSAEILADARAVGRGELDYVAAQAYAAALIAERCLELARDDPLGLARALRTTTFFGAFELDPETGVQRAHRLSAIQWRRGGRELLLADAA